MLLRSVSVFDKIINCYSKQKNETGSIRVITKRSSNNLGIVRTYFLLTIRSQKSGEIILEWLSQKHLKPFELKNKIKGFPMKLKPALALDF